MNASIPSSVMIETGPAKCTGCDHPFAGLTFEDVLGVRQLRCGDVLVQKLDANCIHCGWTFHWSIREKDVQKMTILYGQVLEKISVYQPE